MAVCAPGDTQPCYSGPAGTDGVGICHAGTRACLADGAGFAETCDGEATPRAESCATAEDDDCDGTPNQGCACSPGEAKGCYTGPAGTEGVGACRAGVALCDADGKAFGPCVGEVLPRAEDCGTIEDDSCDGQVNEGCACVPGSMVACYSGPLGTAGVGTCKAGVAVCDADGVGLGPCTGEVLPKAEDCSTAEDESCDGQINEASAGCVCAPGQTHACYSGPPGTDGVGICKAGVAACDADGKSWGPCGGEVLPKAEDCTTPEDESCDGQVNEGCACQPGDTQACYDGPQGTAGVGLCKGGTRTCLPAGNGYGACTGEIVPAAEDPISLLDDNCVVDRGETLWKTVIPNSGLLLSADAGGHAVVMMRRQAAVAGYEAVNPASYPAILVARFDPTGTLLWGKEAYGGDIPQPNTLSYTLDAGLNGYIAMSIPVNGPASTAFGQSAVFTAGMSTVHVLYSVAPDGALLYAVNAPTLHSFETSATPHAVSAGGDGSVFYANGLYANQHVIKYGPTGAVAWDRTTVSSPESLALAALPDGGVILAITDGATVDLGCGPLPESSPQARDLVIARYDAAGNCTWSVRPGPSVTVQRLAVDGAVIALVTSEAFVRASLSDGTVLSTDPAPAALGYNTFTGTVGGGAMIALFSSGPNDFGLGLQSPYGGAATGRFYVLREVGATRWSRAPRVASSTRVAGAAGGFVYATITGNTQLDLDGTVEPLGGTAYFLLRMAY